MKILVAFHDNNSYSGASRSMVSIIETWLPKNIDVVALIPSKNNGNLADKVASLGIKVFFYPKINARINMGHSWLHIFLSRIIGMLTIVRGKLFIVFSLLKKLRKEKIDFLYSNTTSTIIGHYLKKRMNLPHIWHIREFGLLDQNCSFVLGDKQLYKYLNQANLLIAISNSIRKHYLDKVNAPIKVAYNDISRDYYDPYERNWQSQNIVCLSCGSLIPGKGHLDAIESIYSLHEKGLNVELLIAGEGAAYKKYLAEIICEKRAEKYIHLLGQVNDLKSLRQKCHIGIVASRMEGFGRVTIEGMLSGILMIGANSGGTSEIIKDGENGFLFEPGDTKDLARILCSLFHNRNKMESIASFGQKDALKYTNGMCAQTILKYIHDINN